MKLAKIFATLVFLGFALLQFNDFTTYKNSDWWSWVVIYLFTSVISGWSISHKVSRSWISGAAGFAYGAFVFRMQDERGNFEFERFAGRWLYEVDGQQMVQQTNEAGGLLIVAIWLSILAWHHGIKSGARSAKYRRHGL